MMRYVLNRDFDELSIAPCGMNCGTCLAYLRTTKPCPGCRHAATDTKPKHCLSCVIKNCEHLAQTASGFCGACDKFPCARLKNLDKRYRTNYKISLIDNLKAIGQVSLPVFLASERRRWTCPVCGSRLCVHRDHCLSCGAAIVPAVDDGGQPSA